MAPGEQKPISLLNKLCYGMGNFITMTMTVVSFYGVFLLEVAQVLPAYSSAVLAACHVAGGVLNPVIGYLVDRTNTRWGKLKPWIAASIVPVVASYFLMWFSPEFDQTGKLLWYLFFSCALYGTLVAYNVPVRALVMLATDDPKERDSLNLYAVLIGSLAAIASPLIQGQILAAYGLKVGTDPCQNTTNGTGPDAPISVQKTAYMVAALVSIGTFFLCAVACTVGVPERKVSKATDDIQSRNPFSMTKDMLSFRPFLCVLMIFSFNEIAFEMELGNVALAFQYTYDLQAESANTLLALTCAYVVSMIPWYFFLQRFGRKAVLLCGVLIFLVPNYIVWFIMSRELFGDSLVTVAYVAGIWGAFGAGATAVRPFMMTDVLDDFHLKTGRRMETVFYSVCSCCLVIADAIVLGATQLFLQFVDYNPNLCDQPDAVSSGLRYIITVGPLVSVVISLFFLYLYPITEKTRMDTTQALKARKENEETSPLLPGEHTVQYTT